MPVSMNFSGLHGQGYDHMKLLSRYFDINLNEEGFTNSGGYNNNINYITGPNWLEKINTIRYLNAKGKGVVLVAQEPQVGIENVSKEDISWALGNYLLVKGDYTYTSIVPRVNTPGGPAQGYGIFTDIPQYHIDIGEPIGEMTQIAGSPKGYGYMRTYTKGLVIVNATDNSASLTTKLDSNYVDMFNTPQSNTITLNPHQAVVLLKTAPVLTLTPAPKPLNNTSTNQPTYFNQEETFEFTSTP